MFTRSLTYPYGDGDGLWPLVVGTLLVLLSPLLLPILLVWGYTLRVVRSVAAGEESVPGWHDPVDLFVDGLRAAVVWVAYLGVPTVLVGLVVLAFLTPLAEPPSRVVSLVAAAVALLSLPLALVALYLAPAAIAAVAVSGSVRSGFAPGRVRRVAGSRTYATAWVLALAVAVVTGSVTAVLGVTLVGVVAVPLVAFYAAVVTASLFGRGYAGASWDTGGAVAPAEP